MLWSFTKIHEILFQTYSSKLVNAFKCLWHQSHTFSILSYVINPLCLVLKSFRISGFGLWITNWMHTINYLNWSKIKKIHPIVSNKTHGLANSAWGQVWKAFFGHHYIWNKQWSGKTLYVTPFSLQNIRLLAQLLSSLFLHLDLMVYFIKGLLIVQRSFVWCMGYEGKLTFINRL